MKLNGCEFFSKLLYVFENFKITYKLIVLFQTYSMLNLIYSHAIIYFAT